MNQKLLQKQFISRAQMLARVMTSTANIKVTISGTGAYRQPGLINIPHGDFTDPEWVAMVHGWIDHELGHEDETDFSISVLAQKESPLLNEFRNIIEDIRMEESRGNKFRGARANLARLAELAVQRGIFTDPAKCNNPLTAVQMLCLYYGRSVITNQEALRNYGEISKVLVENLMGQKLMNDIVDVIHRIDHAKDNADSLSLAREIMALIKDELEKQKQTSAESDSDADSDSGSSDGDDDSDADSDSGSSDGDDDSDADSDSGSSDGDDDSNADSDSNGSVGDDDSEADSDSDGSDSDSNASHGSADDAQQANPSPNSKSQTAESEPTAQDIVKALEQLLNADPDVDGLNDFHEAIADMLGESAEEAQREIPVLTEMADYDLKETKGLYLGGPLDEVTAKRMSGGVFQTMHKVLFDRVQNLETARKTGSRILNKKISGIPAGNLNVFKRHVEQQDVKAVLHVIVDASFSMGKRVVGSNVARMEYANTCAFAFAAGLERSKVPVEVSYYGLGASSELLYVAKQYDEKAVLNKFKVIPEDTTPTGEMMMRTLTTLALRPENKKMLIVITDGEANPGSVAVVKTATELASAFGIKVVPIGICTDAVSGFDKHEFVSLSDPSQLTTALREAVKLKLF
jgi:hypothetical protein